MTGDRVNDGPALREAGTGTHLLPALAPAPSHPIHAFLIGVVRRHERMWWR